MIKTNINQIIKDVKKNVAAIKKAEIYALNKAGRDAHPEAKRLIRKDFNMKSTKINQAKKKPSQARPARPVYILTYRDSRINVKHFGVRQTARGITWKVRKTERYRLDHGFKVGHNAKSIKRSAKNIYQWGMIRTGRFYSLRYEAFKGSARRRKLLSPTQRKYKSQRREVIKSVTGPSVPQTLKDKRIEKKLVRYFWARYRHYLSTGYDLWG